VVRLNNFGDIGRRGGEALRVWNNHQNVYRFYII